MKHGLRIALYQPDIAGNTGTILRFAACTGLAVDVIEPAGFDLSDRNLRRAGMDYLEMAALTRHVDWPRFEEWRRSEGRRLLLLMCCDFAHKQRQLVAYSAEPPLLQAREEAEFDAFGTRVEGLALELARGLVAAKEETAESTKIALAERDAQIAERDARIAELINSMNGDISRRESTTGEIAQALVHCTAVNII